MLKSQNKDSREFQAILKAMTAGELIFKTLN